MNILMHERRYYCIIRGVAILFGVRPFPRRPRRIDGEVDVVGSSGEFGVGLAWLVLEHLELGLGDKEISRNQRRSIQLTMRGIGCTSVCRNGNVGVVRIHDPRTEKCQMIAGMRLVLDLDLATCRAIVVEVYAFAYLFPRHAAHSIYHRLDVGNSHGRGRCHDESGILVREPE